MKEKFSEEYNLVLQLNHRKKLICQELFSNFRKSNHTYHDHFINKNLEPDIYDLIEPSTFKKLIEDYYEEQKHIADTIHDLTDPSIFEEYIEEYYEIQKCIIDVTQDFSDTGNFNLKDIEKNIEELIEPLSFNDSTYSRQLEEERIVRVTSKVFSHPFFENINKIFDNIYISNGSIKIIVNKNLKLSVSREKVYKIYKNIKDQGEYSRIEKVEITCLFCIVNSLSSVYYVLDNNALTDLQNFIGRFQVLAHFYVKNISPKVFQFFKDPRQMSLIMPRHSAPLLFWFY